METSIFGILLLPWFCAVIWRFVFLRVNFALLSLARMLHQTAMGMRHRLMVQTIFRMNTCVSKLQSCDDLLFLEVVPDLSGEAASFVVRDFLVILGV